MTATVALRHVVEGPEGTPVLVLGNSLGTELEMWDGVVAELGDAVRTVRLDFRGQGRSPVPPGPYEIADLGADVLMLLDDLGIERAAYCGVSIGAMAGLWLAAHAPQRIERLIVCCTSARFDSPDPWIERAATVRDAGSTAPIAQAVASRWLTPAFAAEHPEVLARLQAMLEASPPEGYVACCEALARLDLLPELAQIRAPTLAVGGAGDEAVPPRHTRAIAEAVAGARYEELDPAAHIPMAERPAAVAALIREHLELTA